MDHTNQLIASLPEQRRSDLEQIESGVNAFHAKNRGLNHTVDPIQWAKQTLDVLDSWLLDAEQKKLIQFNPWDLYLLSAAAYLCDIGLPQAPSAPETGKQSPKDNATTRSVYQQSRRLILEHWKALGIGNPSIAAALADICGDVGCDDMATAATVQNEHIIDGVTINGPLLAAAVRLAKNLNPKAAATELLVRNHLSASAVITKEQYNGAFSVTGMGPHPYISGTIQIKIRCTDPEIHRALKHHERDVQRRLNHINRYASPRFLFSEVIFEIEAQGYTPVDLKFSVDTSAALQLLTGNRLYSDNRVFLRELIQNAVDACNLHKRFEPSYEPSIFIKFNQDISEVTIRDNGIGMDRQWIEKYFLTIGISLYQSAEVRNTDQRSRIDFNFISQFGIGFLSSFLVADKIIIKTRKAGEAGLKIAIANLRDYFDVREMEDEFDPGTEVTLHLKPSKINYCRSMEYAGYLKTNIRFLNMPVVFEDQDGRITTIGRDPLSYHNPKTTDIDFIAPLEFSHSQGYLLLRGKKNVDHIFTMESAKGGVSVFQDGIFVTQLDTLLPEGARQSVIGRINLLGQDKCALSMDRNRIFWTDAQLLEIKHVIRMAMADAVNSFLAAVKAQGVQPNTWQSIVNNVSIFFKDNEVDDAIYQRLCEPVRAVVKKRFRDFVRIHFAHTLRAEGIPEADGYSHKWQQRIIDSFRNN